MRVVCLILGIVLGSITAFSQAQMSSGDIKGTVMDATGAVIPNARVTVTNIDTGVARTLTADAAGAFRFFVLPPANYELKIEVPGFGIYTRRPLQLTVGQTVIADAQIQPASISQEIVVQELVPIVETERTQQSDTITTERIQNLPINERNFLNFSLLTPGVTDSNGLVTFTLPQTASSGLSFLGQGGRSNNVSIDGVDNNDNAVGGVRSTMSQEAVQEFQINRSNFSAEFGRASGGLINIVSKSGTNETHGNVFGFFRDQSLDARNPFAFGTGGANIDPPYSRQQAGFTVGGPFKQDRTFYFLSYEGLRQRESRFVTFLENDRFFQPTKSQRDLITFFSTSPIPQIRGLAATANALLTTTDQSYPDTVRLLRNNSGAFPYRNTDNTASLRVDHSLNASNQMFGRFTLTDIDASGVAFGGLKGPSRGTNNQIQDTALIFGDTHFVSPTLVNEFRFQFANRYYGAWSQDPYGPEININGIASLGRDFFLPSIRTEKRFQFLNNVTFVHGKHDIKFGGDFNYLPFDTVTEVFLGGRFIFGGARPLRSGEIVPPAPGEVVPLGLVLDNYAGPGTTASLAALLVASGRPELVPNLGDPITALQAFNFGLPLVYQQGFGDPRADFSNKILSGYIQDNFRVSPKVTLNLGFRYDMELQPKPIHRDKNNWGPRVGFSFSPDSRTVLRGGYGIYYSSLFEAVAFVGRVLNGTQISQVVVPLTGIPQLGITATSAQVWGIAKNLMGRRSVTEADILPLGIRPGVTPPVLLRADDGVVNPYSQQFSLGVEREIPGGIGVGLNYLGNRGLKIIRSRNANLRQGGTNAYGITFAAIDPRKVQDNIVESSGSSIYHGLAVSATKRYSDNYQFQVSYTLSKAIDDTTDFITDLQPANQLDLRNERSLSSFDQRQRLVVSGVLNSPFDRSVGIGKALADVTLSPIVTYGAGHPFNLLLGFDANRDTNANTDRPVGAGRNTGEGPNFLSFDLRLAKMVRFGGDGNYGLEGIFEAFNLFNRVNYNGVNNVVGTATFPSFRVQGRANADPTDPLGFTSAADPRQIQLGVKFRF